MHASKEMGESKQQQQQPIMFWRPNKVGSTTVGQLFVSYAFRNRQFPRRASTLNYFCRKVAVCALEHGNHVEKERLSQYISANYENMTRLLDKGSSVTVPGALENAGELSPYHMSITHEVCNFNAAVLQKHLACAFAPLSPSTLSSLAVTMMSRSILDPAKVIPPHDSPFTTASSSSIKEVFLVREPVARAVSGYYYIGEMIRLIRQVHAAKNASTSADKQLRLRLGLDTSLPSRPSTSGGTSGVLRTRTMWYHGNESSPPPLRLARRFARAPPYSAAGPHHAHFFAMSHTWSLFADNLADAVAIVAESDRLLTLVVERLDESLVVMRHFLGWSLADVVVSKSRKALSPHPRASAWPPVAVKQLRETLTRDGEYAMYDAAQKKLDERIARLKEAGVNVEEEAQQLRELRNRVVKLCFSPPYLVLYRKHLELEGLPSHRVLGNRYRETEDQWFDEGYSFSYMSVQIFTFDVCGNCEAHGILIAGMESGKSLRDFTPAQRKKYPSLSKCPQHPQH